MIGMPLEDEMVARLSTPRKGALLGNLFLNGCLETYVTRHIGLRTNKPEPMI
jgi:hypothetical protein